jgi:hypothetical protein
MITVTWEKPSRNWVFDRENLGEDVLALGLVGSESPTKGLLTSFISRMGVPLAP